MAEINKRDRFNNLKKDIMSRTDGSSNLVFKAGKRFDYVPPGEYEACIIDIKPGSYNGKRDTLEFKFEVVSGDYNGCEIMGFVNAHYEVFSKHSKLGRWYEIVNNCDLEDGMDLLMTTFFSKVLKVEIGNTESKLKNNFSNVKDIIEVVREI